MGIDISTARFLASEMRRGVPFGCTLTLGRQGIYMEASRYKECVAALGHSISRSDYADDLFHALGAIKTDVMDVSNYEGASVIHDLNQPVDASLHGRYDCVFDGGALEHVFNLPVALQNCMEMTKPGGHFIIVTPCNNFCGHGFYQFSPELFYSALAPVNGFSVERLLFVYRNRWYSIRDPSDIKARIELLTDEPTSLFISAKRCEQKPLFRNWPQQSDYIQMWNSNQLVAQPPQPVRSAKETILRALPALRRLQTRWRELNRHRKCSPRNRDWFMPIDIDKV